MFVGLEKHLTQLGWDFVVTTSFSIWGDKHGIFFASNVLVTYFVSFWFFTKVL
jgi:hypothetical protein